jgi:hypothetical protein
MKAALLGGLTAAVLGVAAGVYSQHEVSTVVSSSAGSRLDVASWAAPPVETVWAEGDTTAPVTYVVDAGAASADLRPAMTLATVPSDYAAPGFEVPSEADEPSAPQAEQAEPEFIPAVLTDPVIEPVAEPSYQIASYIP